MSKLWIKDVSELINVNLSVNYKNTVVSKVLISSFNYAAHFNLYSFIEFASSSI
jgi:hypothetical protein